MDHFIVATRFNPALKCGACRKHSRVCRRRRDDLKCQYCTKSGRICRLSTNPPLETHDHAVVGDSSEIRKISDAIGSDFPSDSPTDLRTNKVHPSSSVSDFDLSSPPSPRGASAGVSSQDIGYSKVVSRQRFAQRRMQQKTEVLYQRMIDKDPLTDLETFSDGVAVWVWLGRSTNFPTSVLSTDSRVQLAFHSIMKEITEGGHAAWLAHIKLLHVLGRLSDLIRRETRLAPSLSFRAAVGSFITSQEGRYAETYCEDLIRIARRWAILARPSIFSLLHLTDAAEAIV